MHDEPGSALTLDQAYQATYLWMFHIGEPPTQIVERGPQAVELRSANLIAFVRVPDRRLSQRTVLAVLAAESDDSQQRVIFSTAGFTPAAVGIAEAQSIALFALRSDGVAQPQNGRASALSPKDAPPAPFALAPPDEDMSLSAANSGPSELSADKWVDCPGCGSSQHHTLNVCRLCGTPLRHSASLGSPPSGLEYRCRECGSHDVEVVAVNDSAHPT